MVGKNISKVKNLYLGTDFSELRMLTGSTRNHEKHDFSLIRLNVADFAGTGGFVIRYFNGLNEMNTSLIKEVPRFLLTELYLFN